MEHRNSFDMFKCFLVVSMRGTREGLDPRPPHPLKNHKSIGFLSNTGPNPLRNHKATKPASNVGPSSLFPHQLKNVIRVGPPLIKLSGSAHGKDSMYELKIFILNHVSKANNADPKQTPHYAASVLGLHSLLWVFTVC